MKKNLLWLVLAVAMLALTGCGGGHNDGGAVIIIDDPPPIVETVIPSAPVFDGHIVDVIGAPQPIVRLVARDALPGVLAGVNFGNGDVYRAFLHFPLTTVPINATIRSATLSIVIRSVTVPPGVTSVPIRIELVDYTQPLLSDDFDRILLPPLRSTSIVPPITSLDVNGEVNVDVTPLMAEAQFRGLDNFQVRILQENDLLPNGQTTATPGLIEIDESSVANEPLLTVVYF